MNERQVVELVAHAVAKEGTQKALADKMGVTPSFLHDVLMGRRPPTGKVLEYLGLERIVVYRKAKREPARDK